MSPGHLDDLEIAVSGGFGRHITLYATRYLQAVRIMTPLTTGFGSDTTVLRRAAMTHTGILTDTDSDDPDGAQESDDGFEAYDLTEDEPANGEFRNQIL